MAACCSNQIEIVRTLLKNKARVAVYTDEGYSALTFAANDGHLTVVRQLLGAGAQMGRDEDGVTALQMAERNGHTECARALSEQQVGAVQDDAQARSVSCRVRTG